MKGPSVTRHNWDKIIEDLKAKPGEWLLVAELVQGGTAVQRLRDAGIAIEKEPVTTKLYNLYACAPVPGSVGPEGPADPDEFLKKAKRLAMETYNTDVTKTMYPAITEDDVFIVWFTKTLQNWKAMVSTSVPLDSTYFEITYNGDKQETYVDTYFKSSNRVVPD